MVELTLEELKKMEDKKVFSTGIGTYPEIWDSEIKWCAVRGDGYHDWCIYYHLPDSSQRFILNRGDKMRDESVIGRLVSCTDEAFNLYRF